jgi:hypothetical protein
MPEVVWERKGNEVKERSKKPMRLRKLNER